MNLVFAISSLLVIPISTEAQITYRLPVSSGFRIGILVSGQEITNVPAIRPRGFGGDTVVYNRTGSEDGKIGFAISYFQLRPITSKLSLHTSIGFRRRGFITDSKFDSQTGFATITKLNDNRLDNLFFDVALRLHSGVSRKVIWFLGAGNRVDYLIYSKTSFWDKPNVYRRLEFSPVFQTGAGFTYKSSGKRCFIEFEGNPGVMNVLPRVNNSITSKPVGTYPVIPIQYAQKTAINYSIALSVGFEL